MLHPSLLIYLIEAFVLLAVFRFFIVCLPYSWWSALCGTPYAETLRGDVYAKRLPIGRSKRAVEFVGALVPWKSLCLDKALAVAHMLKRRGIPSTLYIGMAKTDDMELSDPSSKAPTWKSHAWLRSGDRFVIGYTPTQPYHTVKTFACSV